ncbi:hypothetical protein OBBRIDRAFT_839106 [Obba rivulosa]|uniref:Uncharacterized protein n=1 Tax=Obba rivulosa TaxID=1052685 RepID=A0A8E2ANI7_9APHY|nr:hypothetical protein OBBRIDRAFT_839106 [Obba rivulosa]
MSEMGLEEIFEWDEYEKDHPQVWIDDETYKRNVRITRLKSTLGMPSWSMFDYEGAFFTAAANPWDASSGTTQPGPLSFFTATTQENGKEMERADFNHPRGDDQVDMSDSDVSFNSGGRTPSPAPYTMYPTSSTMMQAAHSTSMPIVSNALQSMTVRPSQPPAPSSPPAHTSDLPVSGLRSTAAHPSPTPSPPPNPARPVNPSHDSVHSAETYAVNPIALLASGSRASPSPTLSPSPALSCSSASDRAGPAYAQPERPHVYAQEALAMTIMRMHYSRDTGATSPVQATPSLAGPSTARRSARHAAAPSRIPQATTALPLPTSQPRANPSAKPKQGRRTLSRPTKPEVHIDRIEGECDGGKEHVHGNDCVVVCRWMVDGKPCGHLITSEAAAFKHVQAHAILEGGVCKWIGCGEHLAGSSWRKHIVNIHCGYYKDQCPGCGKIVRRGLLPSRHPHCLEEVAKRHGGDSGAGEHAGEGASGHDHTVDDEDECEDDDDESDEEVRSPSRKRRTIDEDVGADVVKKRRKIGISDIIN